MSLFCFNLVSLGRRHISRPTAGGALISVYSESEGEGLAAPCPPISTFMETIICLHYISIVGNTIVIWTNDITNDGGL